jgi:hypothetical protein
MHPDPKLLETAEKCRAALKGWSVAVWPFDGTRPPSCWFTTMDGRRGKIARALRLIRRSWTRSEGAQRQSGLAQRGNSSLTRRIR